MSTVVTETETESSSEKLPEVAINSQAESAGICAFASAHNLDLRFKSRNRPEGAADRWSVSLTGVELEQPDGSGSPLSGNGPDKTLALRDLLVKASGKNLIAHRGRPNQFRLLSPAFADDYQCPAPESPQDVPIVQVESLVPQNPTPVTEEIASQVTESVTPLASSESVPSTTADQAPLP